MTLKGFTAAYDGPPIKQEKLKERQDELAKQLEEKANEERKKLEDALKAATEGAATE